LLYIISMDLAEKLSCKPQFVSPTTVLSGLGLTNGMSVIDYASGAGHWSLAAAKLVAPKGKVLAIENNINMLNMVKSRAETEKVSNLEIEEIELETGTSKLAKPSDLVIVSNILHLIKDKKTFVEKSVKMLSAKGKLLFIDWVQSETLFGPPLELRMSSEQTITLFEKAGLKLLETVDTGADHFGLVFIHEGDKVE